MPRYTTIWTAALVSLCVGCGSMNKHQEATDQAKARFSQSKADLKYLLAVDQFNNGKTTQARVSVQEAIGLKPDAPSYYLLLAKIFIEEGKLANADKALQSAPEFAGVNPEHAYLSGLLAERYGRPETAQSHYQEAHELDKHNLDYLMAYAETMVNLNQLQDALFLVESRLYDFDGHGRLQALKAEILRLQGRQSEAADAFKLATLQFPDDRKMLEAHAMALYRARRYADAIPAFRAVSSVQEDEMPLHCTRALAHSYMEIGECATALVYWQEISRRSPEDYAALIMQARCEMSLDDLSGAVQSAKRAVRMAPQQPGTQLMLGMVYWRQENWIRARRTLEAAVRVDPTDVLALCLLGQVAEAAGKPGQAIGYYRRALQHEPEHHVARRLMKELQAMTVNDRGSLIQQGS